MVPLDDECTQLARLSVQKTLSDIMEQYAAHTPYPIKNMPLYFSCMWHPYYLVDFYRAMLRSAVYTVVLCPSVRPSVCLCLSQAGTVPK